MNGDDPDERGDSSANEACQFPQPVDPADDFWEAETYVGEEMSAEEIDDVLYD